MNSFDRRRFLKTTSIAGLTCVVGAPAILSAKEVNEPKQPKKQTRASWGTAAPMPINTQELYATVHKGRLYVAGGIAAKLNAPYFTDRFFSYSPADNEWRDETDLPESLHHAALVSTGDRLFLVGGFNGGYTHIWRMRERVYEYVDDKWVPRLNLPQPQAEGVLTHHQGDIHLVTGQSPKGEANKKRSDHIEVDRHLVWQPDSKKWESAAPIPLARNSATGGWLGDQLVITGGRNADGNYAETHIYDKREDRWRDAKPLPLPQAGTASAVVDDELIVFGGEIFVPMSGVFANVWRYSLNQDKWLEMPSMPNGRHGIGAGKIDNKIYVIGGATEPGGKGTTNLNEVLSL